MLYNKPHSSPGAKTTVTDAHTQGSQGRAGRVQVCSRVPSSSLDQWLPMNHSSRGTGFLWTRLIVTQPLLTPHLPTSCHWPRQGTLPSPKLGVRHPTPPGATAWRWKRNPTRGDQRAGISYFTWRRKLNCSNVQTLVQQPKQKTSLLSLENPWQGFQVNSGLDSCSGSGPLADGDLKSW